MGKKGTKKINRKMKRSVRKTIGVLTLIMAVIVAAIPTPSARAVGGTESDQKVPAPAYPANPADDAGITTPSQGSSKTQMAQMIYKAGDQYYLYDVFEYFMYAGSGGTTNSYGCISQYDNSYIPAEGKLVIPQQVYHDYPSYSGDDVVAWFTGNSKQLEDNELEMYYPDEWKAYQDYLAALEEWNKMTQDEKDKHPEKNPTPVAKPSHQYQDFLNAGGAWVSDNGLRFFCSHHPDLARAIHDGQGYMLLPVIDGNASGLGSATVVYMPCLVGDSVSPTADYSDQFYVPAENSCLIRYIGDGAFQNATSITELEIPNYILTIGNDAFNGCSSIKKVSAWSGTLGNRAFKDCAALKEVTLGDGIELIGTECFYGCNSLKEITFPTSVKKIGVGAFASCSDLNTIEMEAMDQSVELADYCFFNCPSIGGVTFGRNTSKIGDAAFALDSDTVLRNVSWTKIVFPDSAATLGDNVLHGRSCLESVVMPASFGSNKETKLGSGFFGGCYQLKFVEFPDNGGGSCGYVTFDTNAFLDVVSEDFYIRGPELDSRRNTAKPRESSWAAGITYVFKDKNGVDQYEVSTGTYRFAVDKNGVLTDCTLLNKTEWENQGSIIEVPANVGNQTVTGIGSDCFSDNDIRDNLKVLKIADDGNIKSIADHAFEGYPKLETVYIGNSIDSIGTSAFADCNKLETVVFSKPNSGYQNFKIGANAFSTKSEQLTFYGDIVKGYAPFDWAMSQDNWMDADELLRVCYSSGTPDHPNLKVLLDNDTNEVTLVGYPHYEQLDEVTRHLYEVEQYGIPLDTNITKGQTSLNAEQQRLLDEVFFIVIPEGIQSIDVVGFCASSSNGRNRDTYMLGDDYYNEYRFHGLFNGIYGKDGWEYEEDRRDKYEQEPRGNDRVLTIEMSSVKRLPDRAFESCENLYAVSLGSALEDIGTAPFTGCRNLTSVGGNSKYPCENGIIYETNDTGLTIVECLPARGAIVGSPGVSAANDSKLSQVTKINEGAFENCSSLTSVDLTTATKLTQIPKACFKNAESLLTVLLPEAVDDIRSEAFYKQGGGYLSVEIPATEVDIADDAFNNVDNPQMVFLRSYKGSAVENYAARKGHTFEEIGRKYRVQFWDYDGTPLAIEAEDGTKTTVQYVEHGRAAIEPEHPSGRKDGYVFDKWDKSFTNVTSDLVIIANYKWGYPDTSPGVLPNTSPGANKNTPTPTPTPNGTPTPGAGTPGAGTPGAGTPGAGTPGASNNQNSNQRYRLTVENGSGSGTYVAGTSVVITANTPPSGQRFDRWTSIANDFNITSATSSITTITMPSHDMTIVANYTSGSGASNGNNGSGSNGNNNSTNTNINGNGNSGGTTVDITKPGISDTDVANATVEGSTDNFVVKITDTAEARAAVEAALINEYGTLDNLRYFAMDISLYDSTGTVKIADTSNLAVNITMPIPDELRLYAGNNQVAGVVNGNVLDKLSPRFTTINGVPCISFTATHFSPYTVYVDTSNLSAGVSDSTPKTGDLIHPKWFLAIALACVSLILLLKKDKKQPNVKTA